MREGEARVAALVAATPELAVGRAEAVLSVVLEQRDDERTLPISTWRERQDTQVGAVSEAPGRKTWGLWCARGELNQRDLTPKPSGLPLGLPGSTAKTSRWGGSHPAQPA